MKLEITDDCAGHGRCYVVAPDLVEDDELGRGVVRGDGAVDADHEGLARRVVRACPENAVRLIP